MEEVCPICKHNKLIQTYDVLIPTYGFGLYQDPEPPEHSDLYICLQCGFSDAPIESMEEIPF